VVFNYIITAKGPIERINMKRTITISICALAASWFTAAAGDSLFTMPIISVSPRQIEFGAVPLKESVTNSFVVENWGGGKLIGKASVPRPFKILSGSSYRLSPGDAQIVTISYTPSGAPVDTNVVTFTGGGGTIARVTGRLMPGKEK
jgi:hypothetical protein